MKSILLPLTAQIKSETLVQVAAQLAIQFKASLSGFFVRPDPRTAVPYIGDGLSVDMVQDLCEAAEHEGKIQAKKAHERFLTCMETAGIPMAELGEKPAGANAHWQTNAGEISTLVGRRARTSDLAICIQPNSSSDDSEAIFHDLIYRSGRPVLMVPDDSVIEIGRRILVAWNGRAESARAVGTALPFLRNAKTVNLLQVGSPDPDRPDLQDLANYLEDHSISANQNRIATDSSSIGEQILTEAKNQKADMVVIGAYSHSRWREMILGGVTRHLIKHSDLPIFMSH